MTGPQSYEEAARLLDGLAEWTSKINAETPLEEGELGEGVLTALVAFGHAMQANTAAHVEACGLASSTTAGAWGKALTDG